MTITLGESDSFLHGGKAEIIIVNVKLDNGKTVTFPFPAKNPIWKVYEAVSKISEEKIITPIAVREEVISRPESVVLGSTDSSSIGREDLVKCVKLYPRGEGATVDLKVGDIYRVLKIVKSGYEVIDDKAATPMRLFVFSDEVVFHQKRKPPLPKVEGKKGKSSNCPICQSEMIHYKEPDGKFIGTCLSCNNTTELIDATPGNRNIGETSTIGTTPVISASF